MTIEQPTDYLVPDLLDYQLKLVFCGTAPSRASAAAQAYYAKPGNKFWPTLHAVGMTPRRFAPVEYAQLLTLKIGLTDLCKAHAGNDDELPDGALDIAAFQKKIHQYQPQWVAFTSKNAAQSVLQHPVSYGPQAERIGQAQCFVLPSPSGLATKFFRIESWAELADYYRQSK